jgi:hypothetical protein
MRSIESYRWKTINENAWSNITTYDVEVKLTDGSIMSYRRWMYEGRYSILYWRRKK